MLILNQGYHDPQRTYSTTARTLSTYPTLSPRTEVYTHEAGSSALLLTLSGTLPVAFRGTTYRFPLKIWLPQAYPQEAPLAYVTPGADMVIRPGQHVGVDGRVYHPYLRDWGRMWERAGVASVASVEELLGVLGGVFEREPPVISRAQKALFQRNIGQPGQQQQHGQQQGGGAPQPPPKQRVESPAVGGGGDVPPPRPPKPGDEGMGAPSRDVGRDGPPLPPLPHERQVSGQYGSPRSQQNGYAGPGRPPSQVLAPQGYQNGRPPGPPPLPPVPGQPQQRSHQPRQSQYERSPVSPVSPVAGYSELPETKYSRPPPLPPQSQAQHQNHYQQQGLPPSQGPQYAQQPPQQYQRPPQQYLQQPALAQQDYRYQHQQPPHQYQNQPPPKPQPPPDLLTDPFDIALPAQQTPQQPLPAPPIPQTPRKSTSSTPSPKPSQRKPGKNSPRTSPSSPPYKPKTPPSKPQPNNSKPSSASSRTSTHKSHPMSPSCTPPSRTATPS